MNLYTTTMVAEGVEEADENTQIEAWQHLIDTGVCWQLQGWFGRTALALITAGICTPANGWPSEEVIQRARFQRQVQRQIGGE